MFFFPFFFLGLKKYESPKGSFLLIFDGSDIFSLFVLLDPMVIICYMIWHIWFYFNINFSLVKIGGKKKML